VEIENRSWVLVLKLVLILQLWHANDLQQYQVKDFILARGLRVRPGQAPEET
jgi:hypothetical protein